MIEGSDEDLNLIAGRKEGRKEGGLRAVRGAWFYRSGHMPELRM